MRTKLAPMLLAFAVVASLGAAAKKPAAKPKAVTPASIDEQEKLLGAGDPSSDRLRVLVAPGDPVLGADDALVTVVEFGDYSARFDAHIADLPFTLTNENPGKVRYVFKAYPIVDKADAPLAAEAALAAGAQGKYWEYHSALFANQTALDRASLEKYADAVGLDVEKFAAALDAHTFKAQVDADAAYARKVGVTGVPTVYVDGRVVNGAMPIDTYRTLVADEIAKNEKLLAADKKLTARMVYAQLMRTARTGPPAAAPAPVRPGVPDPVKVYAVPVGTSPQRGAADAKLTVIVFEDFKCPFCQRVQATLGDLEAKYGKNLRVVFKHYIVHQNAKGLHLAAAAAAEQGKFWDMHDFLFKDISATDGQNAADYAKNLRLDVKRWQETIDSGRAQAMIDGDMKLGTQFGVRGTPAFFINGRYLAGAQPVDVFEKLCDQELARADGLLKAGTKKDKIYDALIKGGEQLVPAATTASVATADKTVYAVPIGASPVRGPADAKLTVVMYTEFRCPYCAKLQPTLAQLAAKYGAEIRFVHMAYIVHGADAERLHRAAFAAALQGKYWEMHDKLFAAFPADDAATEKIAADLGLDLKRYHSDVASQAVQQRIDDDVKQGDALGVNAVPLVFINGRKIMGAQPLEAFTAVADEELAKANAAIKAGTKAADLYDAIVKAGVQHL